MTAALADWAEPSSPARPRRHLVSVPTGDAVVVPGRDRRGLRITRRGRLALTGLVATVAAGGLFVGLAGTGAAAGDGRTVTVERGQTLSEIAATQMPGVPAADAVVALRAANDLPGDGVAAGQELVIPE